MYFKSSRMHSCTQISGVQVWHPNHLDMLYQNWKQGTCQAAKPTQKICLHIKIIHIFMSYNIIRQNAAPKQDLKQGRKYMKEKEEKCIRHV